MYVAGKAWDWLQMYLTGMESLIRVNRIPVVYMYIIIYVYLVLALAVALCNILRIA